MATRLLIVDDEPDVELLIRQRFRREAREGVYEFLFARNGVEALTVLRADPLIEVVLSDINMPVMDGLTLLGHLRELGPAAPGTVIVSAYGDLPNIRAAMNQGAFDFLTKPIDFQDFEVTVRKTQEQVRRTRAAVADRERLLALERDLRLAAAIQRSFLPPTPPPFAGRPDFAVYAAMTPAYAVGGDFYDYFLVPGPDGDGLGLVIGDVSGKGVSAALFMAVCRTLLRAEALHGSSPGECLRQVNRRLLRDTPSVLFVTLFYGCLDPASGRLRYANGGHNAPLLLRPGAEPVPLPEHGLLVGAVDEATYTTAEVALAPGDRLLLYTDGVTEARNAAGQLFGRDRLLDLLRRCPDDGPEALVGAVLTAVREFADGAPPSDDVTLLALTYAGPANRPEGQP